MKEPLELGAIMDLRGFLKEAGTLLLGAAIGIHMYRESVRFGEVAGEDPEGAERHADSFFRGAEVLQGLRAD